MNRLLKRFSLITCLFLMISCASATIRPPEYNYAKNAIRITVKADWELNRYQGSPHTLMACVYQLDSRNSFNQLVGDMDGLYTLLECSQFDSSVTNAERLIIQPGQKSMSIFDRVEKTQYLAVVAGYNKMDREGDIRIFEIPIKSDSAGLFSKTTTEAPEELNIDLILGPERISN